MKWLLSLAFLCLCIPVFAQKNSDTSSRVITITAKMLENKKGAPVNSWSYKAGDSIAWADPSYNDSSWELANETDLLKNKSNKNLDFPGIGWFRKHFTVDLSGAKDSVLGIRLSQGGASEIYIDGQKIKTFGVINGKDSTKQYNPGDLPFAIPKLSPGEHIIAIRYANYLTPKMRDYGIETGFYLSFGYLKDLSIKHYNSTVWGTTACMFISGLFAALCFIHLFLFLYHRAGKSNLYFSVFSGGVMVFLIAFYLYMMNASVTFRLRANEVMVVAIILAALALSAFSNELFSKKKIRQYIIIAYSLLCLVIWYIDKNLSALLYPFLFIVILFEIVFLSIRGIKRKIPGARILGFGISFFGLFILTCVAIGLLNEAILLGSYFSVAILAVLGIGAIFSIPGSISIYLAWSFSRASKDLAIQLQQVQTLSEKTREQELEKQRMLETKQEELEKEVTIRTAEVRQQKEEIEKQHSELKTEKKKSDDLLLNILPEEIAEELKNKGTSEAKYFDHVSVLFTDFVNFTKAGERMTPQELVNELHTCFKAFDEICGKYNIEKIKTIGDAYLAVCGLPMPDPNHAINTAKAAVEIRDYIAARKLEIPDKTFNIRIGIHSGSVVAGIVGVKKFAYDIWGDTVNTAARMEQSSESGKINVSQPTYELIKDKFICTYRGQITAKNKGEMSMYFVDGEK